jgi:hypothetical protein
MAEEDDYGLGSILGGQGSWQQWLSDPANRAGLLSFGLQMMSGGGHGGTTFGQDLATGLAHGFQGSAATDAAIRKQQELDEEQSRKERHFQQELASQEKRAEMGRASREDLQRQRLEGQLSMIGARGEQARETATHKAGLPGAGGAAGEKGRMTEGTAYSNARKDWQMMKGIGASLDEATDADFEWITNRAAQYRAGMSKGGAGAPAAPAAAAPATAPAAKAAATVKPGEHDDATIERNITGDAYLGRALLTPQGRALMKQQLPPNYGAWIAKQYPGE